MGLEIHRMKLRYASMLKLQEKMISEMEKSVHRRESISIKGKISGKGAGQQSLTKAIADLKKKIKATINDVNECEQDIGTLQVSIQQMEKQIEESSQQCSVLEGKQTHLRTKLEERHIKKQSFVNETLIYQKLQRFYQDLRDKKYKFIIKEEENRKIEVEKARDRFAKIESLVQNVKNDVPERLKLHAEQLDQFLYTTRQVVENI